MPELSAEEQEEYDNATECHICDEPFNSSDGSNNQKKVRDHCHILQVCIIIYG